MNGDESSGDRSWSMVSAVNSLPSGGDATVGGSWPKPRGGGGGGGGTVPGPAVRGSACPTTCRPLDVEPGELAVIRDILSASAHRVKPHGVPHRAPLIPQHPVLHQHPGQGAATPANPPQNCCRPETTSTRRPGSSTALPNVPRGTPQGPDHRRSGRGMATPPPTLGCYQFEPVVHQLLPRLPSRTFDVEARSSWP